MAGHECKEMQPVIAHVVDLHDQCEMTWIMPQREGGAMGPRGVAECGVTSGPYPPNV